ncbi:MAG: S-methyl-5-thioribose-1-phosphate isomerase [Candidatus Dadabacteria bacterium]|nr:S-methyl-5-thioribose-1-phosphate isomerase [Candidatus Dadabacteria bacterium]
MNKFNTIEWKNGIVVMIDQRKLPTEETYIKCTTHHQVAKAIKEMVIRGAPAIGVAAAMGMALGAKKIKTKNKEIFFKKLKEISNEIAATRPTAVNLFWAVKRMNDLAYSLKDKTVQQITSALIKEAKLIRAQDIDICKNIGKMGAKLIKKGNNVITHCNAGALATAGYGTALGVLRAANEQGKNIHVYSTETRPFLQGSRLTAWELSKDNIAVTIITDSMAGHVMSTKNIDAVVVGADRIAANGDVANKIGTFSLSVLAKHHKIPFYVAAPLSTIDISCPSGESIPIEQRDPSEVSTIKGKRVAADTDIYNPAFDITPHENIDAIITEKGVLEKPYKKAISEIMKI